jgi:hypothetical protein
MQGDPKHNKNYRNNVSVLIHHAKTDKWVQIDAGNDISRHFGFLNVNCQ